MYHHVGRNQYAAKFLLRTASYLTYPVAKVRELFYRAQVVHVLHPEFSGKSRVFKKTLFLVGVLSSFFVGLITALPGIFLRLIAGKIMEYPYLYYRGIATEKDFGVTGTFSILAWNVCCIGAGYTITDGGVVPWRFRVDGISHKVIATDADIVCLFEVFDISTAIKLVEKLKYQYAHFYCNIGLKSLGTNSGIFIASKFPVDSVSFSRFPEAIVSGRSKKGMAKGVFAFDVTSKEKVFARIYSTHLQHSELPEFPTPEDVSSRQKQMQMIVDDMKLHTGKGKALVLNGDLNLDDNEYESSVWSTLLIRKDAFTQKTWGGDEFCAKLMNKKISYPLNLDYMLLYKGTAKDISTTLVATGYDPKKFTRQALSDHEGLYSVVTP